MAPLTGLRCRFQYISCCSLSFSLFVRPLLFPQFQYISCCSLSMSRKRFIFSLMNFNTSHVVVYQFWYRSKNPPSTFQYISCCSLSNRIVLCLLLLKLFQYISCCSLSRLCWEHWKQFNGFQYISCCSLSKIEYRVKGDD